MSEAGRRLSWGISRTAAEFSASSRRRCPSTCDRGQRQPWHENGQSFVEV